MDVCACGYCCECRSSGEHMMSDTLGDVDSDMFWIMGVWLCGSISQSSLASVADMLKKCVAAFTVGINIDCPQQPPVYANVVCVMLHDSYACVKGTS